MARRASRRQTAGMTFTKNAHLMPAPDDDSKWRAVLAHDRRADTLFVYGVSSTRHLLPAVVCQPASAARPRRVLRLPGIAAREGYRACRRCRPRERRRPSIPGSTRCAAPACIWPTSKAMCRSRARRAARGQPVSPPAQLQAHRRRHAARIRRGVPPGKSETRTARRRAGDVRHLRGGLRIEQALLRARRAQARDVAGGVRPRRGRHARCDTRSSSRRWAGCWSRRPIAVYAPVAMGSSDQRTRARPRPRVSRSGAPA